MNIVVVIICGLISTTLGQSNETSGDSIEKVINGENVPLGKRTYQVSLQRVSDSVHFCGGSIVNRYWIVTAAHCVAEVSASFIKVIAGTNDLRSSQKISRQVAKIIVHENYGLHFRHKDDIALLKLVKPFERSPLTKRVPLPDHPQYRPVQPGDAAVVSGWGETTYIDHPFMLQQTTVYIAKPDYCRRALQSRNLPLYDTQICANDRTRTTGDCYGDSGGPLTVKGMLVGIVSYGVDEPGCGTPYFPNVFTRVSEYVDWINRHIKNV